ncbi:MAG: 50S ribosomal protein L11 methyltransferase [Rhodospirillales bacterium]|nr:50S ribosomal protein L11 methyltransferase [Rhodospirillales bacterium]
MNTEIASTTMATASLWTIVVRADNAAAAIALEAALEPQSLSVSRFDAGAGEWRIEALCAEEPDRSALALSLTLAAAASGTSIPEAVVEPLAERPWLAENRERFAAFRIGRFHIQEPDDETPVPLGGRIVLRIEAAGAFGSGRHGSTEGCLRALDHLAPRPFRRPLDIGCGSGILAIAAARLWRVPVLASDIDAEAVGVCRANARLNGVAHLVRTVVASGYRSPAISAAPSFDLISCNILARPLKRMAATLTRHLSPGGIAVVAGLLVADGNDVLAAHRAAGLRLVRVIDMGGWRTLVLRRGSLKRR